jgi:hypothetical protein
VTPGVTPISYNYSLVQSEGGPPVTGGGVITLSLVPEPSSVILLLIGGGILPLLLRSRGRSRASQAA